MWPLHHKRKTNHELFEEDRNKLAIGYRLILAIFFSSVAFAADAAPYRSSADGSMVWDQETGLVWARCPVGQIWSRKTCAGTAETYNFDQAQRKAVQFNELGGLGGYRDWTLPTVRQLITLRMCTSGYSQRTENPQDGGSTIPGNCVEGSVKPTIDTIVFHGFSGNHFWSSTPYVGYDNFAWNVDFSSGYFGGDRYRSDAIYVRLVRAVQVSDGNAALAFPVKLVGVISSDLGRLKNDEEAKERETYRRDAPAHQARQMCEAQKQTCLAVCPPLRYSDGTWRIGNEASTCMSRCQSINCN